MKLSAAPLVFLVSGALVTYVLALYPALLALGVFRKAPPVAARPVRKTVSLLLPVRNGERWMRAKLESIFGLDYPAELLEVIVISDGSSDGTEEAARGFPQVRLLRIPPSGKAAALNAGMREATGEILFFTDVRQPLDPQCLKVLVSQFSDPRVGAASGELIIRRGATAEEEQVGLYWRYEKRIRKEHSRINSVLGATGAIYAMRRELASPLPPDCLLDDVHLPLLAFLRGYRVIFVEEALAYDDPAGLEQEFRRKVRTLAGVYQLLRRFPALLTPRNRMWIHTLSHKFGRLLLPYALLALLVSSVLLAAPWAAAIAGAQAAFYGLAAMDPWVGERSRLKAATALARTFTALMLATLAAGAILFVPAGRLWRPAATVDKP